MKGDRARAAVDDADRAMQSDLALGGDGEQASLSSAEGIRTADETASPVIALYFKSSFESAAAISLPINPTASEDSTLTPPPSPFPLLAHWVPPQYD